MGYGITRDEALELVRENLENQNLINHCLAAEAVLKALAERLGEDQEKWGLAGLLHDLDAERQPDLDIHTRETAEILTQRGVDREIVEAIRLHNAQAWPGGACTRHPSCIIVPEPTLMELQSPLSTAPAAIKQFSPTTTSPMTLAVSCMKVPAPI